MGFAKARGVLALRGFGIVHSAANFALALMRPIPIVISPSAASKGGIPFHTWMRILMRSRKSIAGGMRNVCDR